MPRNDQVIRPLNPCAERRFSAWRRGERVGVSRDRAFKQIRKDLGWRGCSLTQKPCWEGNQSAQFFVLFRFPSV